MEKEIYFGIWEWVVLIFLFGCLLGLREQAAWVDEIPTFTPIGSEVEVLYDRFLNVIRSPYLLALV